MVPSGWQEKKLKEIDVQVIDGDRGANYPKQEDFSAIGYCLFLNAKNVTKAGFKFDECQFISEEKHNQLRKGEVLKHDIVLTTRGTVGNMAYFADSIPYSKMRINSGMVVLRNNNKEIDTFFLYKALSSYIMERQIASMSFGSAQPQLTVKIINDLSLPIPPKNEQEKIAKILSTWDEAIEKLDRLIATSELEFNFILNKSLLNSDFCSSFALEKVADVTMGASPKSSSYNSEGIGLPLIQGNADIKNRRSVPKQFTSEITKECQTGDILFSVRAPVGMVAVSDQRACIGRGVAAIRAKQNRHQQSLYYSLLANESSWKSLSQGSTFEAINSSDLRTFEISIPNDKYIEYIEGLFKSADYRNGLLKKKREALFIQKQGLMQQLLTGKKRVKP